MNLTPHAACGGLVLGVATTLAAAGDLRSAFKDETVANLKISYLSCERAANSGRLASADIMQCSVIYEELKRRAFDNDFEKLNAWVRSQAAGRSPGGQPGMGRR